MTRRLLLTVSALLAALALPAAAGGTTGLWVGLSNSSATAGAAAFLLANDAPLSGTVAGSAAQGYVDAITPDGAHLYVANTASGTISQYAVDATTGALTPMTPATVADPDAGAGTALGYTAAIDDIAVDPDADWVYAVNPAPGPTSSSGAVGSIDIFAINPVTGALTYVGDHNSDFEASIAWDDPESVAFSPDGNSLYVGQIDHDQIYQFDVNQQTGAITPKTPNSIALGMPAASPPNGIDRLATAEVAGSPYLYVSDNNPNNLIHSLALDSTGHILTGTEATAPTDTDPIDMAVDHDGTGYYLYAAAQTSGKVDEFTINPSNGDLTATTQVSAPAGTMPDGLAVSPDGSELWAGNSGSDFLSAYEVNATSGSLTPDPRYGSPAIGELGTGTNSGPAFPVSAALPDADLQLGVSAPASVTQGGQFTYTFTVTDAGPAAEDTTSFTNTLPGQVSFVSAATSQGNCSGTTSLSCALGPLSSGAAATVTITVTAASTGSAVDTASATGSAPDPNTANNSATATTSIAAPAPAPPAHQATTTTTASTVPLAPPVLTMSTNLARIKGTILVRLPGTTQFVAVTTSHIPIGTVVDADNGTVQLTFALPGGKTQTADFYGGEFEIASQSITGVVTLKLFGPLHRVATRRAGTRASAATPRATAAAKSKKAPPATTMRALWGSESAGLYTTQASAGSAAVRGTTWATEDFPGYSRFYVARGKVVVTDFRHHNRKVTLTTGQCYQTSTPKHCTPSAYERSGGA